MEPGFCIFKYKIRAVSNFHFETAPSFLRNQKAYHFLRFQVRKDCNDSGHIIKKVGYGKINLLGKYKLNVIMFA